MRIYLSNIFLRRTRQSRFPLKRGEEKEKKEKYIRRTRESKERGGERKGKYVRSHRGTVISKDLGVGGGWERLGLEEEGEKIPNDSSSLPLFARQAKKAKSGENGFFFFGLRSEEFCNKALPKLNLKKPSSKATTT